MSTPSWPKPPLIEEPPDGGPAPAPDKRELALRIRQQAILAELGVIALRGVPLDELLQEAARLSAEALEAEYCKVLQYIPAENRLVMRAGVGWAPGLVGVASVGADMASP